MWVVHPLCMIRQLWLMCRLSHCEKRYIQHDSLDYTESIVKQINEHPYTKTTNPWHSIDDCIVLVILARCIAMVWLCYSTRLRFTDNPFHSVKWCQPPKKGETWWLQSNINKISNVVVNFSCMMNMFLFIFIFSDRGPLPLLFEFRTSSHLENHKS